MKILLISIIGLLSLNVTFAEDDIYKKDEFLAAKSVNNAIDNLVLVNLVCTQVEQCQAIAVGDKACGGPIRYIVASKNNPYFTNIESLAKTSKSIDKTNNERHSVPSDCAFEVPPEVQCLKNKCSKL